MDQKIAEVNRTGVEKDGAEIFRYMLLHARCLSEAQICSRLLMLDEENLPRPPEMRTHDAVEHLLAEGKLRVVDEGTSVLDDPFTRVVEVPLPSIGTLLKGLVGK